MSCAVTSGFGGTGRCGIIRMFLLIMSIMSALRFGESGAPRYTDLSFTEQELACHRFRKRSSGLEMRLDLFEFSCTMAACRALLVFSLIRFSRSSSW